MQRAQKTALIATTMARIGFNEGLTDTGNDMSEKIRSEIILVTPEKAREFLSFNEGNRYIRSTWVEYLANCIRNNEWQATHQGIGFSKSGMLLDGQHRLHAIIKADIPVMMMVTYGLADQVFSVLDSGIKRTDADLTKIPKATIEVIRIFHRVCSGAERQRMSPLMIDKYYQVIGAVCAVLNKKAPTKVKLFSAAPCRAAAIYAILTGESVEYVMTTYKILSLGDTQSMSPICHSAVRQVITGRLTTAGGGDLQTEVFLKLTAIFKEKNKNVQKLIAREKSAVLGEVRKELVFWFSDNKTMKPQDSFNQVNENLHRQLEAIT